MRICTAHRPLLFAVLIVGAGVAHADGFASDDAADIVLVEEEEADELIILEPGDDEAPPVSAPSRITGPLGRLWEAWHIGADSQLAFELQHVPPADGPLRLRGEVDVETWLLPAPNLKLYGTALARVAVDGTAGEVALGAFADLYEATAQVNLDVGAVQLGRMVVPWGRTQAAALGDRLQPPDYRRGAAFPAPGAQRQPQLGALVRTSLGALAVEGVVFARYDPAEGSIAASSQGGVRIARYQGALVRSPARVGGLGRGAGRAELVEAPRFAESAVFGLRLRRRLGDLDTGASVVWGFDETPSLQLPPDVARYLAQDALTEKGAGGALAPFPCARADDELACLGGPGALQHRRTLSLSADVVWGLGVVILKGEVLLQPRVGVLPGKTAIFVNAEEGLHSGAIGLYGATLAVEGAIMDGLVGSLELFDVVWTGVPAGRHLHGVELLDQDVSEERAVHRPALGASLSGAFGAGRVRWALRGEAGLLQRDVLASFELRYRLPIWSLYVGGRGNLFAGPAGSPGWLRQDATLLGLFVGEGS